MNHTTDSSLLSRRRRKTSTSRDTIKLAPTVLYNPHCVVEVGAHSVKLHRLYGGEFRTVKHPYELGHEVYTTGKISESTAWRVVEITQAEGSYPTVAIGTSAVRDAENRESFVRLLQDKLRLSMHVLTCWEEAALLAEGYLAQSSRLPSLVADIGGGSLELVYLSKTKTILWDSLPLGAIRLHNRALADGKTESLDWLQSTFEKASIVKTDQLYATGGTAKAVAKVLRNLTFTNRDLERLQRQVVKYGPPPELKPARARVFPAGLTLLAKLLDFVSAEQVRYLDISIGRVFCSVACGCSRVSPQ